MLSLKAKQVVGKVIAEEEWGKIDMTRGEPLDNTWREVRGKEGINEEGWWQVPCKRNMGNAFHREKLTPVQVDRIGIRKQRGEKVYININGNIKPTEINSRVNDRDWNRMEEEREINNAGGEETEVEDMETGRYRLRRRGSDDCRGKARDQRSR